MGNLGHNSAAFGEQLQAESFVLDDDHKKLFHYVNWQLSDYITGTQGMTVDQEGVYMRFLVRLYDRGKPFPDDDRMMARVMSMDMRPWRRIKLQLVEMGKIVIKNESLTNSRFEKERIKRAADLRKQAQKTREHWEKKRAEKRTSGKLPANFRETSGELPEEVSENGAKKVNKNNDGSQYPTSHTRESRVYSLEEERKKDSVPNGTGPDGPIELTAKDRIWGAGIDWLRSKACVPEARLRSRVGRWCKDYGDEAVLDAFAKAHSAKPGEPLSWIEKILLADDNANRDVTRKNDGRIVVMNGFSVELGKILDGGNVQTALDRIAGRIPVGVRGVELMTKVRSLVVDLVEKQKEQDRRYAAAAETKGAARPKSQAAIFSGVR